MRAPYLLSLLVSLAMLIAAPAPAQEAGGRLAQLAEVLGRDSGATPEERIRAIEELAELKQVSALASGMLFERANVQFEPEPEVREAAALALPKVCQLQNRLAAMRLARIASAANEPDPRVRIAALKSLAAFQNGAAASAIYDAAMESKEPDAQVRKAAKELIQKGLASSLY
jgi:hypothetical protein